MKRHIARLKTIQRQRELTQEQAKERARDGTQGSPA